MAKKRTIYTCEECGYESSGWLGKCPACGTWNSMHETVIRKDSTNSDRRSWLEPDSELSEKTAINLAMIGSTEQNRLTTEIEEMDRVLGGGFVQGSMVLLGGDPGIGKSTLLLQVLSNLSKEYTALYISGEESPTQIKMRSDRLGIKAESIRLVTSTDFATIAETLKKDKPDFAVIDSIQSIYIEDLNSAPGSVSQVREATAGLLRLAKRLEIAIVLVGHVTKEGGIAGPRVLEHMVDAVLYFEGERANQYRLLRAVKNRFGTTNEVGMFEMTQTGLKSVENPSTVMLAGRPLNVPGTAITSTLEGTRSVLLEIQALLNPTDFAQPIRNTQGIDRLRLNMLLAILQKSCSISAAPYDAYVNVTGGLKIVETSADLAVIAAVVSSIQDKPIDSDLIILGELGLAGEVRMIAAVERRIQEALRLGWKKFLLPAASKRSLKDISLPDDCEIYYVSLLREALDMLFY
ncbi:MAG: DNA repair protein RadA [Clostridiaceae bacterium]|jgi:DNA repair protein RadA/Sms|nr:DNA repair protein RadA [Clostridiaceae bacterium]